MRHLASALLSLLLLAVASPVQAQDAEVIVTFDRGTSAFEAQQVVRTVTPALTFDEFSPLYLSIPLDAPPPPQTFSALFESGAVSVEVVSLAAQTAAWMATDPEEMLTDGRFAYTKGPPLGYMVRVGYASTTTTDQAAAAFASALGTEPATVKKQANEIRLRVPELTAQTVAGQLQSSAGVVAVRVQ